MTFSHEQIQEHLLGFLAGELTGEARAAFDAHLSGCDACRDEVRGFERARMMAREVVRAPLDRPVPSELRARVLAAAAAARKQTAGARSPAKVTSEHQAHPARPGWLARWFGRRNARWTFPTFATVAAMAVFLLVRQTVFREANRPLPTRAPATEAPPVAAPSAPPSALEPPLAPSKLSEDDVGGETEPQPPADKRGARRPESKVASAGPLRQRALGKQDRAADGSGTGRGERKALSNREVPAPGGGGPAKGGGGRVVMGGSAATRAAAPAPRAPSSVISDEAEEAPAEKVASQSAAKSELDEASLDRARVERERSGDEREGSAAPAPKKRASREDLDEPAMAAAPAPAAAPRAAERVFARPPAAPTSAARGPALDDLSAQGNRYAGPPPPPPPAAPSAPPAKKAKDTKPRAASAAAPEATAASAAPDPVPALVDHAEKLMAARRFKDAAMAYRELLRRFPNHAAVPTWRKRLATAEAADAASFAAPPP